MFSPELFLSLLKLIYGCAHEGIGTIELMPLAGTIFATRRIKLSRWKVKTISARCSVTWPMSPSLSLHPCENETPEPILWFVCFDFGSDGGQSHKARGRARRESHQPPRPRPFGGFYRAGQ